MTGRGVFVAACALWAWTGCQSDGTTISDHQLIGQTVASVRAELELEVDPELFVIDEPPGVPRGIEGKTPEGVEVELYIRRGDVKFNERMDWALSEFDDKKVIGVARRVRGEWKVTGQVMLIRTMP